MLKLFRQNVPAQLAIILVVGVALWMPTFMDPAGDTPHPLLQAIIAFAAVLAEGWMLTALLYNHKLMPQNTLLPMLAYVCLMSSGSAPLGLTPMLLVNLLVLGCVQQLMVNDTLTLTYDQVFRASALVAVSSLCYLPSALLLLPLVITFLVHSLYRWRNWVMLLLGLLAPYILVATVLFLCDRLPYHAYLTSAALSDYSLTHWSLAPGWWGLAKQAGLLLMVAAALVVVINRSGERTTMYRKNMATICLPLLSGVLMTGYTHSYPIDMQSLALPAATMLSTLFLSLHPRKKSGMALANIIFILFLALCF